ncbi:phosphoribosyltransferase [Massilia aerilata]|uniref:Phosphoribosyltransferase n=1 Tax=Massilia aerilata TaxID=453817 RepID=A0ABW0RXN8_9BURK
MAEFRRFKDRTQAGKLLARDLREYAGRADAIVLALPRGGVPVGFAIAQRLAIELDILLVRKLGLPNHEEYAMGAVGSGGVCVLQPGVPGLMGVTAEQVEAVTRRELDELQRRERAYRGARAPLALAGRTAILVDDGVATGSTMLAAIRVARGLGPGKLVLAVPVAPPQTLALLEPEVDHLVCLAAPPLFRSVGQWYDAFDQTSDEEVQDLLADAWHARTAERQQPHGGPNHATTADDKHDDDGHRA